MKFVSIIIPCYNEAHTIRSLLDAIFSQTYPISSYEVIVADGLSRDQTRQEIDRFKKEHPDLTIRVVDNPRKIIPAALNLAILHSKGDIILRLDAHCAPSTGYVARSVADLEEGKAENVGGVWEIRPGVSGWLARSIALAAAHPLGVGDALYRFSKKAEFVDTVPFGCFKRTLFERIGLFDETLLTNEDYEFNARIRKSGGRIWLDPNIKSVYFARPNLVELARQYWRYGYWKLRMLRRYPTTLRWRQALPPLFVLGTIVLALLSLYFVQAQIALAGGIFLYFLILLAGCIPEFVRAGDPLLFIGIPVAIATMHLSWGTGFLVSILQPES